MKIKRMNTYELINSEGPLLIFELYDNCGIFIFPQELSNKRIDREKLPDYLNGNIDIVSAFGKSFNLSKNGAYKDMIIERNLNTILENLNQV